MSYISEIFKRADTQRLIEYLLHGGELLKVDHTPYEQRLKCSMEEAIQMIDEAFPEQAEKLTTLFMKAISAYEEVYMEIGLQTGIILVTQFQNMMR